LTRRPAALITGPTPLIAAGGLASSLVVGVLTAHKPPLGIGVLIGLLYLPLVLLNLQLGLALWVVLMMNRFLPIVSVGPTAASILVLLAWVGTISVRRDEIRDVLERHSRMVGAVAFFCAWISVSALWATKPSLTTLDLTNWFPAVLTLVVVATTATSRKSIEWVVGGFVAGALISVLAGAAMNGLHSSATAIQTASSGEGRLSGGAGDPNYLAAGLVPAIVLASGLAGAVRNAILRWSLLTAVGILAVGLAATESRGGLVAAAVALFAAVLFYRRRRAQVLVWFAVAVSVAAVWFTTSPAAWHRISHFDATGTGRTDLWRVAWQAGKDHPIVGVGLNNYRAVSGRYVRRPGALHSVALIVEKPHVVHNAYLQLFAETGIIGLGLFLSIVIGCLLAAFRAALRFDELNERGLAGLARGVLVGTIGMLAASFFLSDGSDPRLWVLLALGPALLALASKPSNELRE
jgi:O-antigen ligase